MALLALLLLPVCSDDRGLDASDGLPTEQFCFDFTDYLHTVSLVESTGPVVAVDHDDGMAYLARGAHGLKIVDLTDPVSPVFRGGLGALQTALDVIFRDGFVYVALGSEGVAVVDVGDPDRPSLVGRIGTPGNARGITVSDTIAYVADDVVGLMLVGIGSPDNPCALGVDNSPGTAVDAAVSGAFAYVADEVNGLRVVNVNNPAEPWLSNTVSLPGVAQGVAVAGGHAFVAAGTGGLQIVDVSRPGAEAVVGTLDTRDKALTVDLVAGNGVAFIASGGGGTEVVDVSQPGAPIVVNAVATLTEALGASTNGGLTLIAEGIGGLRVVRSANPLPPPVTARILDAGEGPVMNVAEGAGMIFGTGSVTGLFTVDPGDTEMQPSGTMTLSYEAVDLAIQGDTAYVAAGSGGIEIVDVTDPADPAPAGWVPFQEDVVSLDAVDDVLYFVGGQLFGTWTPGDAEVTTIGLQLATITALTVAGGYAYAGERANSIDVVYVSDPKRPLHISTTLVSGTVECLITRGEHLFVLTSSNNKPNTADGLGVYQLLTPITPVPIEFLSLSAKPFRAALSDDYLYVAVGVAGLEVIDVSDPVDPVRIGSIPSADTSVGTVVSGGSVFVADGAGGLFSVPAQSCVP